MKRHTLHIHSLVLVISLLVHPAFGSKCSRLIVYDSFRLAAQLESDLTSSVWTMHEADRGTTVSFAEDGSLERVNTHSLGQSIMGGRWEVSNCEGRVLLTMTSANGQVEVFDLKPNCTGFDLLSMNGRVVSLEKIGERRDEGLSMARRQIAGSWEIITDVGTQVEWMFEANGTFWVAIGPDKFHSRLTGEWSLTDDGMHLDLEFMQDEGPEQVYAREVVRIHHVDFEDLIFSGALLKRLCATESSATQVQFAKKYRF